MSIFLAANRRPVQISYLFFESVGESERESEYEAVREALESVGQPSSDAAVAYAVSRLKESVAAATEIQAPENGGEKKRPSFYTQYLDFVSKLNPEQLCLYLADGDIERAEHLYCRVDVEDVNELAKFKIDIDYERARVQMEAALFGFGGKYEDQVGFSEKEVNEGRAGLAAALGCR